MQSRK
jgi:hypothetical protein